MDQDWADSNDLANLTRSTSPLADAGYDVDALRMNPEMRAQAMQAIRGPYASLNAAASGAPQPAIGPPQSPAQPTGRSVGPPAPPMSAPRSTPRTAAAPASAGARPMTGTSSPAAMPDATRPLPDYRGLDEAGREALRQSEAMGQSAAEEARKIEANPAPDTSALETKIGEESAPTPYLDASGKPMPQYKPSDWQRVGRGLKSAALGFFEGGPFGAAIGAIDPGMVRGGTAYGAPNSAYQSAEATRQAQLGTDTQQLSNLRQRWKDMVQSRQDAEKALGTGVTAEGDVGKLVSDLTPKTEPKPVPGIGPDGKATFATPLGDGRFVGPDGQVLSSFAPTPPKPAAETGKPTAGMLNGKPAFGLWDAGKNLWMNATPGPGYGLPMPQGWVPSPTYAETGMYEPVPVYDPTQQTFVPGTFNRRTGKTTEQPVVAPGGGPAPGAVTVPPQAMRAIDTARETAREADTRLAVMQENYEDAVHGDQQAMLSLLANHLGMTMGLQKGARLNQALIEEAMSSRPWLQGMQSKFDSQGYLTGVTLSQQQMQQMLKLAQERDALQWRQAEETANQYGIRLSRQDAGPPAAGGENSTAGWASFASQRKKAQ